MSEERQSIQPVISTFMDYEKKKMETEVYLRGQMSGLLLPHTISLEVINT